MTTRTLKNVDRVKVSILVSPVLSNCEYMSKYDLEELCIIRISHWPIIHPLREITKARPTLSDMANMINDAALV